MALINGEFMHWHIRQAGTLLRKYYSPGGCKVQWEDGEVERFTPEQAGPLLNLSPGDRFEAVVERTPWTPRDPGWRPVRVHEASKLGPPPTPEQCQALWDRVMSRAASSRDLPGTSWD